MRNVWIVLAVLLALAPELIPVLVHPDAAGKILLHGGAGFTLLLTGAVLGGLFWLKRSVDARKAAGDPDETAQKRRSLDIAARVTYGVVIACGLGMIAFMATTSLKLAQIQRHGARADAEVVDIFTGTCSKHGCSMEVQYRFVPAGRGGAPIIGYSYLANSRDPDNPRWIAAETTGHVPIAYDTTDPTVSALNFNDSVFRVDHLRATEIAMLMIGGLWGVVLGIMVLIFRNARAKLEAAAKA